MTIRKPNMFDQIGAGKVRNFAAVVHEFCSAVDSGQEEVLYNYDISLSQDEIDAARNSFRSYLYTIGRNRKGGKLSPSPYSYMLADCLQYCWEKNKHLAHMTPPELGKSTTIRLFFTWILGKDPTLSTAIMSSDEDLSRGQVGVCRAICLNPGYSQIFPEVDPDIDKSKSGQGWAKGGFYFKNATQATDPTMASMPVVGMGTGQRLNCLYADDIISMTIAASPAVRDRYSKAAIERVESRVGTNGIGIITHNCWHRDDLIHRLEQDQRFVQLRVGVSDDCESLFVRIKNAPPDFPVVADPGKYECEARNVEEDGFDLEFRMPLPAGSEKYTAENLREIMNNQPVMFREQYRMIASDPDDLMFPAWPLRQSRQCTAAELLRLPVNDLGEPMGNDMAAMRLRGYLGIDPAGKKRKGTALAYLAVDGGGQIMPGILRLGRYTDHELAFIIQAIWESKLPITEILVEDNAVQSRIIDTLGSIARERNMPWWGRIVPFTTGTNKRDPVHGLPLLNTMIHNGQFLWPELESRQKDRQAWTALETALATTPKEIVGGTSDILMATWFAAQRVGAASQFKSSYDGFSVSSGDDEGSIMDGF